MLRWQNRPAYMMLVPLQEILAEVQGMGVASKGVQSEYERLITLVGSELQVLTKTSLEELERVSGPRLREAVEKVRKGDIFIDPGYDGVFGVVKIWGEKEKQAAQPQQESLF
jgi:PHP family Zn ribbon phosphoesterase